MVDTVNYRVRRGDNLQNIVQSAGFPRRDWRRIYDAPYNRSFRRRRPDPDHIEPGDIFVLPRYNQKDIAQIVKQIETVKSRVSRITRGITETERAINNMESTMARRQEVSNEHIRELRQRVDHLESLVMEATDACEDEWSCMGGGLAAQSMIDEQRGLERQIRGMERQRDYAVDKATRDLRGVRQSLQRLRRAQANANAELQRLHGTHRRAMRSPY